MYGAAMSSSGRPFDLCDRCQAGAKVALADTPVPFEWLSSYLRPDERHAAFEWAQEIQPSQFLSAFFRGLPIGEWVTTSVVSYFRCLPIRLDDWHPVNVFRGFLHGTAVASVALSRLLDDWRPDSMILLNGRLSVLRVAFNLARARGIRVLVHEAPKLKG